MSSARPRFSIVIPSYNQAAWLEACIKSVLGQEGVKVEAIVMDGGSTDSSKEIIERYAPRLAYWQSAKDGGQSAAIKAGFDRATGDILGWLNSDDVYLPGALAKVSGFFAANPEEEAVTGGGFFIDVKGDYYRWRRLNQNHTYGVAASHGRFLYFKPQQSIWQPATFWRRGPYEAVGGLDPQFHYIMDFDLFTRLSARRPFANLPELLACFRIHADNKTHALRAVYHSELKAWAAKYRAERGPWWLRAAHYLGFLPAAAVDKAQALWREAGSGRAKFQGPRW